MSLHRRVVVWAAEDGTWSFGAYDFDTLTNGPFKGDDFNPEWDVAYDTSAFWFAGTGFPSSDAACEEGYHAQEANPGCYEDIDPGEDTAKLAVMVEACHYRNNYSKPRPRPYRR